MKVKDFFQMVRTHDDNKAELRPLDEYDVDITSANGHNVYVLNDKVMEMEIDHIDIEGRESWGGEYRTPYIEIYVK